jgi:hypothetical protein
MVFASLIPTSVAVEDIVLTVHWLLECAICSWPEQSQLEGIVILVDGTGADSDPEPARTLGQMIPQVIGALKSQVPLKVAGLLGLNCGGRLEDIWTACAKQVQEVDAIAFRCYPTCSEQCVKDLAPFVNSENLLQDHGGNFDYSHQAWCDRVDQTMCDEVWPWPNQRPSSSLSAVESLLAGAYNRK